MKCPHCREEIEENLEVCPICGENIPVYYEFLEKIKNNILFNKKNLILTLSIGILFISAICTYNFYSTYINDPTYKSIVMHEDVEPYDYKAAALFVTNVVSQQNNDIDTLLKSSAPKHKKGIVFNTYLNNLEFFATVLSNRLNSCDADGIKYDEYNPNKMYDDFRFITPKLPIYKIDYGYVISVLVDYKYILETFAAYLTDDWKEYLKLKIEFIDATNDAFYMKNYEGIDKDIDAHFKIWQKKWDKYTNKYPEFPKNKELLNIGFGNID